MALDTTQFHNYESSIQRTRSKQRSDLSAQVRESLDKYRERYSRVNFLEHRIAELEEKLEMKGQQLESLHTTFNCAMFRDDTKSMEEAKASRVEVAAEIETIENELVELRHEYEDSDFDPVAEGESLLEDVRTAKGLIAGDVRTKCLDDEVERAFVEIDQDTRDQKLARVREKRAS